MVLQGNITFERHKNCYVVNTITIAYDKLQARENGMTSVIMLLRLALSSAMH